MRLIDADALVVQWEESMKKMKEPVSIMFTNAAINDVKEAPTVEAIPIDWLQEFIEWNWDYLTGPLNYILDKWKETQEWEKWKADETD